MLQVSTGYKSLILGPNSWESIFNGGVLRVFSGSPPPTADHPEASTLLGYFTQNGGAWRPGFPENGLTFSRNGPYVSKLPWDVWMLIAQTTGVANWWRLVGNAQDDGDASITLPRIDGAIGAGNEMALVTTSLVAGQPYTLDSFFYTIPPIVGT